MIEPTVLRYVRLGPSHRPTGKTRHFIVTGDLPQPHELRIVQYEGAPGYYLFYCDENGTEMTDTYHDSLEEVMSQATWEFNVKPDEWNAGKVKGTGLD